jgi:hypothetical protein
MVVATLQFPSCSVIEGGREHLDYPSSSTAAQNAVAARTANTETLWLLFGGATEGLCAGGGTLFCEANGP